MKDINLNLPKILDWLLSVHKEKNFLPIIQLLHHENIDLLDIINYYCTHQNPKYSKNNRNDYARFLFNLIKSYVNCYHKNSPLPYDPEDEDEYRSLSFGSIINIMKRYNSKLYFDWNENIFLIKDE